MSPSEAAPDFKTVLKNAGKTETIISFEKSLKKETSPIKKTFFSTPKIFLIPLEIGRGRLCVRALLDHSTNSVR